MCWGGKAALCRQAYNWNGQMYQRQYGPLTQPNHPRRTPKLIQLLMLEYGDIKENSPQKPHFRIFRKQVRHKWFCQIWFQVQKSKSAEGQQLRRLPRARAPLPPKNPLLIFLKTWEKMQADASGMTVPSRQQTVLFCALPTRRQRTVQNLPQLPPSLRISTDRTSPCLPAQMRKRLSSPQDFAQPEDCVELPHAKFFTLNTSALSNPDSLTLSLTSDTLLTDPKSLGILISDSLINSVFVQTQHLPTYASAYQDLTHQWNLHSVICRH